MDIPDDNQNKKVVVFWQNDKDLYVEIGGKAEILSVSDALEKYGNNSEFVRKYNALIERRSYRIQAQRIPNDMAINIGSYARKFIGKTDGSSIEPFKAQYDVLVNQLKYDEQFADYSKQQDRIAGLSAWEASQKDIMRTKEEKRGVCTTFTFRIQDELEKLGIENYPLVIITPGLVHWANLYVVDGEFYVCDITRDIVYSNVLRDRGADIPTIPSISVQVPLAEYLQDNANASFSVPEKVSDNGKKFHEMAAMPLQEFITLREKIVSNQYFGGQTSSSFAETGISTSGSFGRK